MSPPTQPAELTTINDPITVENVLRHVKLIHDVMKQVMTEGTHYGPAFPGDTKKSLRKPGAEKLLFTFRLAPTQDVQAIEMKDNHREYRIKTTIRMQATGQIVAEGVGSCSTMESKYRYRNAAITCPICRKECVIKGKDEYGGGWLCHYKRGGCGAKFATGDAKIESQERGKVENPDIADAWNTALKIASKRSLVAATILATAAGDIFAEQAEDQEPEEEAKPDAKADAAKDKPGTTYQTFTVKTPPQRFIDVCNAIRKTMGDQAGDDMIDRVRENHGADAPDATQATKLAALLDLEQFVATGELPKMETVKSEVPF